MGFQLGHLTDQGRVRTLNEDSYLVLTQPHLPPNISLLMVVADGMGGHQAGDVASGQVVATLDRFFSTGQFQQLVDYNPERSDYYAAVLKDVLEAINDHLVNLSSSPGLAGMGTTATVALLSGNQLFIGHVGDSRAYILRNGILQQITQDHSWVADQVASGAMTAGEAYHHPKKNLLLRALGNNLVVRVDRLIQDVYPSDTLILCSDGLTNKISEAELAHLIVSHTQPQAACQQLIDLANSRGGEDNITLIVARLDNLLQSSGLPGGRAFGPQQRTGSQPKSLVETDKILQTGIRRSTSGPSRTPQPVSTPMEGGYSPLQGRVQSLNASNIFLSFVLLISIQLGVTILTYLSLPLTEH